MLGPVARTCLDLDQNGPAKGWYNRPTFMVRYCVGLAISQSAEDMISWIARDLSALLDRLHARKIKPMLAERTPLSEARRPYELLSHGSVEGKLVLICNSPTY